MAKNVTATWTDPSPTTYVDKLELWRKLDGDTSSRISGVALGVETFDDDTGVTDNQKYFYEIRAYNTNGNYSSIETDITISSLYLLDNYTDAEIAYSLRKLRTGETYSIEVRRDNDNALTDVELYTNGASLDLSSTVSAGGNLGTWVGSNSAFVRTWYDQSGNDNHAIQSTLANQPMIIDSGTLLQDDGFATIVGDGATSSRKLIVTNALAAPSYSVGVAVYEAYDNTNSQGEGWDIGQSTPGHWARVGKVYDTLRATTRPQVVISGVTDNTPYLYMYDHSNTTLKVYLNSVEEYNASSTLQSGTQIVTLFTHGTKYFIGGIREIIIWDKDISSDRTAIQTNVNSFYSIY